MALERANKTIRFSSFMNSGVLLSVLASVASFAKGGEMAVAQERSGDQGCLAIAKLLGHRDCSQYVSPLSIPRTRQNLQSILLFLFQTKILNISPREGDCGSL